MAGTYRSSGSNIGSKTATTVKQGHQGKLQEKRDKQIAATRVKTATIQAKGRVDAARILAGKKGRTGGTSKPSGGSTIPKGKGKGTPKTEQYNATRSRRKFSNPKGKGAKR